MRLSDDHIQISHGKSSSQLQPDERWVNKKQTPRPNVKIIVYKDHIYKRNGEYWFGNKRVKDIIRGAREQGLIVGPPVHKDCQDV